MIEAKIGDTRTIVCFAWLPITMFDGSIIWLRKYEVKQEFSEYVNIDYGPYCSDNCSIIKYWKDVKKMGYRVKDVIVTNRPTKKMMERAKKEGLMVLTFIHKPDSVIDYATSKAFQEGWLKGLGLDPNPRLALITIPKQYDLKECQHAYLEALEKSVDTSPLKFSAALQGIVND